MHRSDALEEALPAGSTSPAINTGNRDGRVGRETASQREMQDGVVNMSVLGLPEGFPVGMRVLVIDDDRAFLKYVRRMLIHCHYNVKVCHAATTAVSVLQKREDFDIILTDVHMPEMDGFGLLELLDPEMDPPVILVSSDNNPSSVMRGINQGACDYLVKPVRKEELKNLWQHVVRKRMLDIKKQATEGDENNSSEDYVSDCSATHKKRIYNGKMKSKKARLTWSGPLHKKFVNAVDVLGVDKAVPKQILQLMNVPGVTRENVGSHLQKYREYLKKLAEKQKAIQQSNITMGSLGFDLSAFSVSGQINVGIPAVLNDGFYGQSSSSFEVPAVDQAFPEQASMQGQSSIDVEEGLAFDQPPINFQPTMSTVVDDNLSAGVNFQDTNMLGQEGSKPPLMNQNFFQSSSNLQAVKCQAPPEQNFGCDNFSPILDFSLPSTPIFDLSFDLVEGTDEDLNYFGVLNNCTFQGFEEEQPSKMDDGSSGSKI